MGGIADGLAAAKRISVHHTPPPKGFEPGVRYDPATRQPTEAVIRLSEPPGQNVSEAQWRDKIKEVTGLLIPDDREVILTDVRHWGMPGAENVYAKYVIRDRSGTPAAELQELFDRLERATPPLEERPTGESTLVVAWADLQVGKLGSRGGTPELVDRVRSKLDMLERHAEKVGAGAFLWADVGDCLEGFENVAGQQFTNDLSLPEQMRVARRLATEAIVRLSRLHARGTATVVPSNHTRWRRGKGTLGKPSDDFGIEILTAVADGCALNPEAFGHVSFVVPEVWEESIVFDCHGTNVGFAHGHQVNQPNNVPRWWADQCHGGQLLNAAHILVTGHFHHHRTLPSGRHADGRQKWWLAAPTVDNGSDWFRLIKGDDSDPHLMCFTVDQNGWRDLTLL